MAGFVLAQRGSPVVSDPRVLDVAEFFVVRKYRRSSIGGRAAALLWEARPGKWTVRVSEGNRAAVAFWRRTIADFSREIAMEEQRPGEPNPWRVFSFESPPGAARAP